MATYKASELIVELQKLAGEHGDLVVHAPYYHSDYAVVPEITVQVSTAPRGRHETVAEPCIEIVGEG